METAGLDQPLPADLTQRNGLGRRLGSRWRRRELRAAQFLVPPRVLEYRYGWACSWKCPVRRWSTKPSLGPPRRPAELENSPPPHSQLCTEPQAGKDPQRGLIRER